MSSYSFAPIPPSSQIIMGPSLSPVKHAQTITLTCAPLKVFFTYFRLSLSPGGRMTHCRRVFTPIHTLHSSDQITFFQSSIVQYLYFISARHGFEVRRGGFGSSSKLSRRGWGRLETVISRRGLLRFHPRHDGFEDDPNPPGLVRYLVTLASPRKVNGILVYPREDCL